MQTVTQPPPPPSSCISRQNQEAGAAHGVAYGAAHGAASGAAGATSSRDPDDPAELAGARVHTTTEGRTPALALDTLIIQC